MRYLSACRLTTTLRITHCTPHPTAAFTDDLLFSEASLAAAAAAAEAQAAAPATAAAAAMEEEDEMDDGVDAYTLQPFVLQESALKGDQFMGQLGEQLELMAAFADVSRVCQLCCSVCCRCS
jgi:hypothetical protein